MLVGDPGVDAVQLLSKRNEERKTTDRRRLDSIIEYAKELETCRVVFIRRYFEGADTPPCGRCDRCQPKLRRRRRRARRPAAHGKAEPDELLDEPDDTAPAAPES